MSHEPNAFLETLRPVRARTAARLEADRATLPEHYRTVPTLSTTIGSTTYHRDEKGQWVRAVKTRNPAYWDRDSATVICDARTSSPMPMLFCRYPMTEVTIYGNLGPRLMRALNRLVRKEWGKSLRADGLVIEGVEVDHWKRTKLGPRFKFVSGEFRPVK